MFGFALATYSRGQASVLLSGGRLGLVDSALAPLASIRPHQRPGADNFVSLRAACSLEQRAATNQTRTHL